MNIQPYQLLFLMPLIAFCLIAWKVKNLKVKLFLLAVLILLALFNPFRFTQRGGETFDQFTSTEEDIPNRVVVSQPSFQERQKAEMTELKKDSMESENETNN